jgi:hypothetical protein
VLKLGDDLLVASNGANGTLVNTTEMRDAVFFLVKAAREAYAMDEAERVKAAKSAAGETCDVVSIYADAERLQGLRVKNSDRALFVPEARKSFLKHGVLTEVPSIARVRTCGVSGGMKRKLALPGADGEEDAEINLNETRPRAVLSLPDAKHAARITILALIAIFSVPISGSAYGGRDAGWASVPGEAKQIRFYLTREVRSRAHTVPALSHSARTPTTLSTQHSLPAVHCVRYRSRWRSCGSSRARPSTT